MYGVFFHASDMTFVDPEEFATREVKSWKMQFDGTTELAARAAGVPLRGAPLASWVLARLAALSESTLFPADFIRREGELGGFRIRLLAVRGTLPIAKLRIAAECGTTELIATAPDERPQRMRSMVS